MCSFSLGSGAGLVLFSKVLDYLLKHFKTITISVLVGFIFGSLGSVWPWKGFSEATAETDLTWHQGYLPMQLDFPAAMAFFSMLMGIFIIRFIENYAQKDKA